MRESVGLAEATSGSMLVPQYLTILRSSGRLSLDH